MSAWSKSNTGRFPPNAQRGAAPSLGRAAGLSNLASTTRRPPSAVQPAQSATGRSQVANGGTPSDAAIGKVVDVVEFNSAVRIDAVIASATASVAEVCDAQVGQVRTALSHACESEVKQLRAVLAEACKGETEKLRDSLSTACEGELNRVKASLAAACQLEVTAAREACQAELERVKASLAAACRQEVAEVREACQSELQRVRASLTAACTEEVANVRQMAQSEVMRVKASLAEACQQEVQAMVSTIEQDMSAARTKQRRELEEAAEPYLRAVQVAHEQTTQQIEQLQAKQASGERRVAALESVSLRTSQRVAHMSSDISARNRIMALDSTLRAGCRFLLLRVVRPDASGGPNGPPNGPRLSVTAYMARLSGENDALLLWAQGPKVEASTAPTRLSLAAFRAVTLGAPGWCCKAAALDLSLLQADDGPAAAAPDVYAVGRNAPPPQWQLITLHSMDDSPPTFLCAPTEAQALAWAAGLAPLVSSPPSFSVSYAELLWRRVRLRLDAKARAAGAAAGDGADQAAGSDGGDGSRARTRATRLGVLGAMLLSMAEEEEARNAWVRYHLASGEREGTKRMGWTPSVSEQSDGMGSSGSDQGSLQRNAEASTPPLTATPLPAIH